MYRAAPLLEGRYVIMCGNAIVDSFSRATATALVRFLNKRVQDNTRQRRIAKRRMVAAKTKGGTNAI